MRECGVSPSRLARTAIVVAIALGFVACGSTDPKSRRPPTETSGPSGTATPTGTAAGYDPPHAFSADKVSLGRVPRGFFYLDEGVVYLVHANESSTTDAAAAELVAVDVATGRSGEPRLLDAVPEEPGQILITPLAGKPELFAAYIHVVKGVGTALDKTFLRVRRYSLEDAALRWSVDVPTDTLESLRNIFLVAVNDQHVVISVRDREAPGAEISRGSTAIVLNVLDGATRWIRPRFIPYALAGDVVPGTTPKPDRSDEPNTVEALNARTGAVVWTFRGADISRSDPFGFPVGTGLVQINTHNGQLFDKGVATTHLVDIATGRTVIKVDRHDDTVSNLAVRCRHDGDSLIVCSTEGVVVRSRIIGFDARTYRQLWNVEEGTSGRKVPEVVDVRRGVVYLKFPATLDARTGADLDVELEIVPEFVGPGYALLYDDTGLVLYRATK